MANSDTRMAETDPKHIYLQPECCVVPSDGRQWCEDDIWDCEDGAKATKYVRADLAPSPPATGGDLPAEAFAFANQLQTHSGSCAFALGLSRACTCGVTGAANTLRLCATELIRLKRESSASDYARGLAAGMERAPVICDNAANSALNGLRSEINPDRQYLWQEIGQASANNAAAIRNAAQSPGKDVE